MRTIEFVTNAETPHIAMIGGGTGSFTLLQELKEYTPNITALVNMSDDGGSTGRLRDELGVLPPGDVRQCLVALSNNPEIRDMFKFRFGEGSLAGHSVGNLILSSQELLHGNLTKAIKVAGSILDITGEVVPISLDSHTLAMQDADNIVRGEFTIGHHEIFSDKPHVWLEPAATINPDAEKALLSADLIAIAPGNLYGSLIPSLAVGGVKEVLCESDAPVVMVANLVTKPGQTDNWHVVDYIRAIERYAGQDRVDSVLFNNQLPPTDLLEKYAANGEQPVAIEPERFAETSAQAIGDDLIAGEVFMPDQNDKAIRRTLIRHDAKKVSKWLMALHEGGL